MTDPIRSIHIAYGSESGNAQALAQDLHGQAFLQKYDLHLSDLNSLDLSALGADSLLLVITSSFGEGGPPSNADGFSDGLRALGSLPVRYCVFGLGDTSYPAFCGFSKNRRRRLSTPSKPIWTTGPFTANGCRCCKPRWKTRPAGR